MANCKGQWNAVVKKYKEFFEYTTGNGTGEESVKEDAKDWDLFDVMHEYAKNKDNYHPPFLIGSTSGIMSSSLVPESEPEQLDLNNFSEEESSPASPTPTTSTGRSTRGSVSSRGGRSRSSSETPQKQNQFEVLNKFIQKETKRSNKKISALMSVFGQIVQQDYPNVDVSSLLVVSSDSDD